MNWARGADNVCIMALSSSVVLCTYNGARYLASLWESLLAQSRVPDEIVVRDDASTDGTPSLIEDLGEMAEARGIRVRFFRGEKNIGYIANFEAALRAASGDVLFLSDQDDVWHARKLATQLAEFERRCGLLLLCGDARRVDASGVDLQRSLFEVLRVTKVELDKIHGGGGFGVLLRRSLATGATVALRRSLVDEALPVPEGWIHDEWLAIVAAALDGFDCIESPLIDYRQHGGNQIGMPERSLLEKCKDMLNPRAEVIDALARRDEVLLARLDRANGLKPAHRLLAAQKLEHLRVRQGMRGMPWSRAGKAWKETLNGRYRLYSSGWRSALRDLVRHR